MVSMNMSNSFVTKALERKAFFYNDKKMKLINLSESLIKPISSMEVEAKN